MLAGGCHSSTLPVYSCFCLIVYHNKQAVMVSLLVFLLSRRQMCIMVALLRR